MAIPTTIEDLSTTPASNGPSGSEQRTLADDGLRQAYAFIRMLVTTGSNIASASSITPPSTGSSFNITGTTTITAIASTNSWNGRQICLIFAAALQLTHSSNFALPGSSNITTAANDIAFFIQTGSGAWRMSGFVKADGSGIFAGSAVVGATSAAAIGAGTDKLAVAGAIGTSGAQFNVNPSAVDYEMIHRGAGGWQFYTDTASKIPFKIAQLAPTNTLSLTATGVGVGLAAPGVKFHVKDSVELVRLETTTARGSGSAYVRFYDPTGAKGYFGYGSGSTDEFDLFNSLNADLVFGTNGSEKLRLTSDGRLYGTALHNNAGSMAGSANQYVGSGTVATPTLTNVSNVSSSTTGKMIWTRVGNVVVCSGTLNATATGAGGCIVGLALPIASNLAAAPDLSGTLGSTATADTALNINGDTTNDRANVNFTAAGAGSRNLYYSFSYEVL